MKRFAYLWCITACLICLLLATYTQRQSRELSSYVQARTASQKSIAELRRKIAALEAENKTLEQQLPGKRPKKPTELSDKERFDRMMVKSDAEKQTPAITAYWRGSHRRLFQDEYGDLFRELNLPPDVLERFKQLLVEKYEAHSDATAIVASQGISSFSAQGRSAEEQATQLVEQDIAALLGDEKYAAYKEYDRVYRDTVRLENFQAWLADKNIASLDKTQVRLLATACCDVSDKARNPDYATISNDYWGTTATQQILQRAQDKLTPEQAKAFAEYRATWDAAEKATDAYIRGEAPLPTPQETKSL